MIDFQAVQQIANKIIDYDRMIDEQLQYPPVNSKSLINLCRNRQELVNLLFTMRDQINSILVNERRV